MTDCQPDSQSINQSTVTDLPSLGLPGDGLATFYNVDLGTTSPGHIQYNGIGRVGVRFDAGAAGLNTSVKSVWVRFRKYGNPTGNITIGIRKASDDSLVTIGYLAY
jgi:hypothetical protein